ncbi:MAG: type I DNA topoisomerase [Alphaproteobacteria bacterium]
MKVVVVESPAKAKTINKYLGDDYKVLASYGHVRDLPPKEGSVDPEHDFVMKWQLSGKSAERVHNIAKALKGADQLLLATDPDREGEAISWHVRELLEREGALKDVDVKRVVFNEITKNAILDAVEHPRDLNRELIDAYLARRALDYLVGFTLSPVLWRKLPGSKSAGRVQSVALRLICEREAEIESFVAREYWSIEAVFRTPDGKNVVARLTHLDGKKLGKFDLSNEDEATAAARIAENASFRVATVEKKQTTRNPYPPFTTSTLQQEASRKLGLGAARTMRLAQDLYEGARLGGETVGLITYMRTDSVTMAQEAVHGARRVIAREYGDRYVPDSPRLYKSKAKNAQEAHEAIRPTDLGRSPARVAGHLDRDHLRLYELIWKRALASQMASAKIDQVSADIGADDGRAVFRATGSTIAFDGFLTLYQEGRDDPDDENGDSRALPPLSEGSALAREAVKPEQHFTQPPPRYTEASLVKRLEELGIGRPSTYAAILQVLQQRKYVELDAKRLVPQDRGRLVTSFLTSFFERYVEYDFTADLENQLDDISAGKVDWKTVLQDFWIAFKKAVDATSELRVRDVLDELDRELGPHFFRETKSGVDPRKCPACGEGRLSLKLGRYGAFIGCSRYPDCGYTSPLSVDGRDDGAVVGPEGLKLLGADPETGLDVSLRRGPYGYYIQLGEASKEKGKAKEKPKRASIPKNFDPAEIDLKTAHGLLNLPREVGRHPESGKTITAGIGRFGPYLNHDGNYVSLKNDDDVLSIGLNRAVTLIAEAPQKRGGGPGREIGPHPEDSRPIMLKKGRFGPYLSHGSTRASLPSGEDEDKLGLERAVELLAERSAKSGKKTTGRKTAKKAAKKTGPKKKTAGKAAPKRKTAKKSARKKTAPKKQTDNKAETGESDSAKSSSADDS